MSRLTTLEIGFTWETMQNFMEPVMKKYKHTRIITHVVDTTRTPLYYIKPEVLRCLE